MNRSCSSESVGSCELLELRLIGRVRLIGASSDKSGRVSDESVRVQVNQSSSCESVFSRESGEFRLVGRVQVNQSCSG